MRKARASRKYSMLTRILICLYQATPLADCWAWSILRRPMMKLKMPRLINRIQKRAMRRGSMLISYSRECVILSTPLLPPLATDNDRDNLRRVVVIDRDMIDVIQINTVADNLQYCRVSCRAVGV